MKSSLKIITLSDIGVFVIHFSPYLLDWPLSPRDVTVSVSYPPRIVVLCGVLKIQTQLLLLSTTYSIESSAPLYKASCKFACSCKPNFFKVGNRGIFGACWLPAKF